MKTSKLRQYGLQTLIFIGVLILLNVLSHYLHTRWDLTSDRRYTLSENTLNTLDEVPSPIMVEVLLNGDLPQEFKKLQVETLQLLEEYKAHSSKIHFKFTTPISEDTDVKATLRALAELGISPLNVSTSEQGKTSQEFVFPWAIVSSGERIQVVSLLKNKLGATDQERVQASVQQLEYQLTDAIHRLFLKKTKKIAVLRSNGTLEDGYIADAVKQMGDYYRIAPFSLDSTETQPQKVLQQLEAFDLLIVPKPTQPFSDIQKEVLDQYAMQGGKFLWLIDAVSVTMEDLYNSQGKTMVMPLDLRLGDLFFSYGFRINYTLVNDLYFTQVVVAKGEGNETRYSPIPWVYSPMILSKNNHSINEYIEPIRLQFASGIDTLANGVPKKVLLTSSALSKIEGVPREISLEINPEKLDKTSYQKGGNIPVAVLLEGSFPSMYKDRLPPIKLAEMKKMSEPTKMIVVSDGDIIKNDMNRGVPLELGYDKWTNNFYDNKAFLRNCVSYLFDETDGLQLRNKKVQLSFLDKSKLSTDRKLWELLSIALPLLVIVALAFGVHFFYKKKYR